MTYEETKLSVIIVNYNVKYFLEQCLYSVRAAVTGMDAEVFVVDNNSTDGSVEYLRPKFPEVVFIENKDNPGFAKANNQAIRQCTGEYVLLLNPDTVVGEESLRSLCFQMDEDPEIGAIGVKMLNGHGVFLPESKRAFPSPWVSFCKIFGLSKLFPNSPVQVIRCHPACHRAPHISHCIRARPDLSFVFLLNNNSPVLITPNLYQSVLFQKTPQCLPGVHVLCHRINPYVLQCAFSFIFC